MAVLSEELKRKIAALATGTSEREIARTGKMIRTLVLSIVAVFAMFAKPRTAPITIAQPRNSGAISHHRRRRTMAQ